MEEIRDLIKIVTAHTKKNIPLLDLKAQEDYDNKELKLFLGIKKGVYDTDEEASKGIYGDGEVDFKFRMLKSRLNRKLLNHLFFMDFSSTKMNKSNTMHQECLDYLHFARMLLKVGEVKYASKLLYKTIDLAKECEFTDIVISSLVELRDIYATTYRPKLFQNIQGQISEYKDLLVKEERANSIYFENKLLLNSSITNRKKDYSSIEAGIKELDDLFQETSSFNVFTKYLKLRLWYYELNGEFERSLELIDEIEQNLKQGNINDVRFNDQLLHVSKLYAMLKLNRLEEGIQLAQNYLKKVEKDNVVWFSFMENLLLMNIKLKKYDEAANLLNEVVSNKAYNWQDEHNKEKWSVYRAYLYFITGNKSLIKKFEYNKYIEEVPDFEKDKAGVNVAILILQLMANIDSDLSQLHYITNALDEYVSKYLNNTFNKKTKIFYKLLSKIPAHNRDFDTILQKSKYLSEKLVEADEDGDAFADLEVVPYEHLWEMIIKRLSVMRYQQI